ncbi:hypothetical protein DSCO28_20580 [Desulfosarcina ovata subsp. sediminis]|uniref:Peptidoglycan binding-like domain-containing protein n=1 Tax=Desulfosarcina ovata subsp. sediminis TaxID=885957 RepID=A0A5K7ZHA7_9BACT|nr:peptidoglycan-binding domain-containing protein [Desulfosarcina ovata]BBO81492.1 hypothetical protein DSCO28_20580 [Desulfosarcina ovata subsp. sediminis]
MPFCVIRQGECISSIAAFNRIPWRKIWEHPHNSQLRQLRKNPNILLPGDKLYVPQRNTKSIIGNTDQRHRFQLNDNITFLRLRIAIKGRPLSDEPYHLTLGGTLISGRTSVEGELEERIPAGFRNATLNFVERNWTIQLALGELDPTDTASGAAERLRNLNYYVEGHVDAITPVLREVIGQFQRVQGLNESRELDSDTVKRLSSIHGC